MDSIIIHLKPALSWTSKLGPKGDSVEQQKITALSFYLEKETL